MVKRSIILTLLFTAYTIVLAHSIIPHHHHHDEHETTQLTYHHDDHHDDADHDHENSLSHDFENYVHSGATGDLHQQPIQKFSCNSIAIAYVVTFFDFYIKAVKSPLPIFRHSTDHIPLLRRCLSNKGLRAPPSLLS
ncbi:MAG: hypothetical protein V4565_01725 [Bacteroidota bacterium]